MRVLFDDDIGVAYSQFYVTTDDFPDMTKAFAGQSNGLCGAGVPGALFLTTGTHSGRVGLRVEWHDREPPAPPAGWEEVVEVPFTPADRAVSLLPWGGERSWPLDLGPVADGCRARYHARGMDEARENRYGEPTPDEYLLAFWPADGPTAPDAVLRQTSDSAAYWHRYARGLPPPPTPQQRAEAERRARIERERRAEEACRQREVRLWGGRPPGERLRRVVGNVFGIAHLDRDLVDAVAEADAGTQRRIARWAARHAYTYAGIADLDWLAPAWRALDRGEPLPAWCADFAEMYRRVEGREIRGASHVRGFIGGSSEPSMDLLFRQPVARVPMALPALTAAALPDPLQGALEALWAAATAYGPDVPVFLAEVRRAFPDLGGPPEAPGSGPPAVPRPHPTPGDDQSGDGSSRSRL